MILPARDGADVLVANYHAPREINTGPLFETLQRFGVKKIVMQKDVFDPGLYFRLLSIASFGDLGRMPQFKSADDNLKTGQLLTYPVLMTHDVIGYKIVLVGEDQRTHMEYARKLIRKHNREFKTDYLSPAFSVVGGKVMSLRKPQEKMSKSCPDGCLFLDDPPDVIREKLRQAVTDADGVENLRSLHRKFCGGEAPEGNLRLKNELADALVALFQRP